MVLYGFYVFDLTNNAKKYTLENDPLQAQITMCEFQFFESIIEKYLLIFVLYVCVILCEFGTAISKRYACFCCLFKIIMSGLLC
jgi:hypothetical protein